MDEDNQVAAATNAEEMVELEETTETEESVPKSQYEQVFARAKKAETELRTLKTKPTPVVDDSLTKDVQELKAIEKKRQFGYQHSLSPEETDKLFQLAGDRDPAKVLEEDEFFKAGLAEMRRKQAVARATPSSTGSSPTVDGKSFKEMTSEERAKNWAKIVPKK